MKTKRVVILISSVLLMVMLAISLTACLKIGMREKNVLDRLNNADVAVTYERTSPITAEGQSGYRIGDIIHGTKTYTEQVDGEDVEKVEEVYVFFAQDIRSADWVEEKGKQYVEDNSETLDHWNVYRYEEVVVVGYFRLVSIVKQY